MFLRFKKTFTREHRNDATHFFLTLITGGDLEFFSAGSKARPGDCALQPLALWDTHFVCDLDDSGYIDRLYQ